MTRTQECTVFQGEYSICHEPPENGVRDSDEQAPPASELGSTDWAFSPSVGAYEKCRDPSSAQRGWGTTKQAHLAASLFRGAGWGERLRLLTRNVHEPWHAKFVSEHAKGITPWGFLQGHADVAAGQKLLEIAL